MARPKESTEERFWKYVEKLDNGCWEWRGCILTSGYGQFSNQLGKRKMVMAHRFSYELHKGEILSGHYICHSCDNRKCVNPDHLFSGTQQDNMNDMIAKGRSLTGDKNPRRIHPETAPRGENHHMRRRPELILRGENNPTARLTEIQARHILSLKGTGVSLEEACEGLPVGMHTVWGIWHGRLWKHLSQNLDNTRNQC